MTETSFAGHSPTVHHLTRPEKQRIFQWISISLRDGGLFAIAIVSS